MKTNVYVVSAALSNETSGQPLHTPLPPITIEADNPQQALDNVRAYLIETDPRASAVGAAIRFLGGATQVAAGVVVVDASAPVPAPPDESKALADLKEQLADLQLKLGASEAASLAKDSLIVDLEQRIKVALAPPAAHNDGTVGEAAAGETGSSTIPGVTTS